MLKLLLKFTGADVCSPDDLGVLAGLNVDSLSNQSSGWHWLAWALTKRVLLSISIRVEGGCAEHSVNVHKPASLLEVRHHGWSLKHAKESFIELSCLTCEKVLECDLPRAGVLVGWVDQVDWNLSLGEFRCHLQVKEFWVLTFLRLRNN